MDFSWPVARRPATLLLPAKQSFGPEPGKSLAVTEALFHMHSKQSRAGQSRSCAGDQVALPNRHKGAVLHRSHSRNNQQHSAA